MLGVFADNHNAALSANDLALFANGLNRRLNFHLFVPPVNGEILLRSPGDSALCEVVGRHLKGDLVTGQNLNKVLSELTGNVCQDLVVVAAGDLNKKHCVWQRLYNGTFNFDHVCFWHGISPYGF